MLSFDTLMRLPRSLKRALLMASDGALLLLAVWLAFSLRLGEFYLPPSWAMLGLLLTLPAIGVSVFERFGLYRLVTRYIDLKGNRRIIYAISMTVLLWGMIVLLVRVDAIFPRSAFILVWLIGTIFIIGIRSAIASLFNATGTTLHPGNSEHTKVVIYGAGSAGHLLANELKGSATHRPIAFVDDDPSLWGQKVGSIKVRRPEKIADLIAKGGASEILLALPSASHKRRREVLRSLEPHPVPVKTMPSIAEIASGRVTVTDIRPISVDDLLGRDAVTPNEDLLARDIKGKAVMITGAGGSIGSELSRQVLQLEPARLVLFELSEIALYNIEMEIRELDEQLRTDVEPNGRILEKIEIVAVLGSVLDGNCLRRTLSAHGIVTIYHAAAYKHVPIVELNPITGLQNNTFGTRALVEAASEMNVERFVLISTDKAVRPTNIMGASKRLAELVLQAHAARGATKTIFTMVRFGNVLASSGSVVHRFTKQIEAGGPVTVTHKDIIRYFMSIPEAAQLVIQAGAMASGGDVFVLDMGEPVKIDQLARMMIGLAGMRVDGDTDGGEDESGADIAIEYTGLRPGEKLFEELLLGENTVSTGHPRIMRSDEPSIPFDELAREFANLESAMNEHDTAEIHSLLLRLVDGYHTETDARNEPKKLASMALKASL